MKRTVLVLVLGVCLAPPAAAQSVLIRNATVHTVTERGTLHQADVRVADGRVAEVGIGLVAPAGVQVIEANGRPLTPGLFAGIAALGLEEVELEPSTVDHVLDYASTRPPRTAELHPEFDVTRAFNPRSSVIPVARVEGYTFTALGASSGPGSSLIGGEGAVVRLDGSFDTVLSGSQTLYVQLGSSGAGLTANPRAAQYMLLEQAIAEARAPNADSAHGLLTPAGKQVLARYLKNGRVAFHVHRAADILQVLNLAQLSAIKPIIIGGDEAWLVAAQLAKARTPVFLDPLHNLPANFDQLAVRLDNAALLAKAGVEVGFILSKTATHYARKLRHTAGLAVAHGLPWDTALEGLTRVPASVFGVADRVGSIAPGLTADLVLWSGDPLEVTTYAEQVWLGGRPDSMQSRQTLLRDRYLGKLHPLRDSQQ
jgi:hypothetical protein